MYNLLISFAFYIAAAVALNMFADLPVWGAALLGTIAFILVYFLLSRVVMKKVGVIMETAQKDVMAGRVDKAVKELKDAFRFTPWQIYVKGQLNAQIGMLLYLKRDFNEAFTYLQKGFVRHWVAMGMLGICYMKRQKIDKMIETFDKGTAASRKEPMLWNLYAYCLDKVGQPAKAIAAMEKGVKKVGGHELLESNLVLLKEGKKMKMLDWGDLWYQFHLESQGTLVKQQTKAMQGRRKIVRK
ncbi:MAG: hypothetical protein C0621_07250 [Desulfuromonas sp.]|nr:MAG: hypothetical protein C0621_07250 [Desulfuromonas sp.]